MLEWHNENSHRCYPFVSQTIPNHLRGGFVDLHVLLGNDIPIDFDNEHEEFRLKEITSSGPTRTCVFQAYRHNDDYFGSPILLTVHPNVEPMSKISATSVGSLSSLSAVIGSVSALAPGQYHAPVVARCLSAQFSYVTGKATSYPLTFAIANTIRRRPISSIVARMNIPDFESAEALANYVLSNIPPWRPNMIRSNEVVQIPNDALTFKPGFNVSVSAPDQHHLVVELHSSAGNMSIVQYIQSQLGSNDQHADLDNDGTVSAHDVDLARAVLQVPDPNDSQQVPLRRLQDVQAVNGHITLKDGKGVRIEPVPDQHKLIIHIEQPEPPYD